MSRRNKGMVRRNNTVVRKAMGSTRGYSSKPNAGWCNWVRDIGCSSRSNLGKNGTGSITVLLDQQIVITYASCEA